MKLLKINGNDYPIPEQWNELTGEQLYLISKLSNVSIPVNDFKLKLLLAILNFKVVNTSWKQVTDTDYFFRCDKYKRTYRISAEDFAYIVINSLKFLFTEVKENGIVTAVLNCKLTRNIIPSIKTKTEILYGPADGLTNMTFKEFIHCETFLSKYRETKSQTYLDKIIATLYRPQVANYNPTDVNYKGDIREEFNDFLIDDRAIHLQNLDVNIKHSILLFYDGSRSFMASQYKNVFSKSGTSGTSSKNDTFISLMKVVNTLAKNDPSKIEEMSNVLVYIALLSLDEMIAESKKMQENFNKNKK